MRAGNQRYAGAIAFSDGEEPSGISLGADYCAEHEWGIKNIEALFGIGKLASQGIEKSQITQFRHERAVIFDDGTDLVFVFGAEVEHYKARGDFSERNQTTEDGISVVEGRPPSHWADLLRVYDFGAPRRKPTTKKEKAEEEARKLAATRGFRGAWDENSFAISARGDTERALLREVIKSFVDLDAVIMTGYIARTQHIGGLNICVKSKLPQAFKDKVLADDIAAAELEVAFSASGIREALQEVGINPNLAEPKWTHDENGERYIAIFMSCRKEAEPSGWFTEQELQEKITELKGCGLQPR